jgi:hypothetical protein
MDLTPLRSGTFLFDKDWLLSDKPGMAEVRKSLKTAVLLGAPCDFDECVEERWPTLEAYYGSRDLTRRRCIRTLLDGLSPDDVQRLPRVISIVSQLDPEEVTTTNERFTKTAEKQKLDYRAETTAISAQGYKHNHIRCVGVLRCLLDRRPRRSAARRGRCALAKERSGPKH